MNSQLSDALFARACEVTPGGVNSPVRAFASVGGQPRFIASAEGAHLRDADGNVYIDHIGSWGPMILGHNHPRVREAIADALQRGTSFGAPSEGEVLLAEKVVSLNHANGVEKVRFVSSGTEATMSAIRLARGFTGRSLVVKFRGHYHGHADGLLVQAGSGLMTLNSGASAPSSAGVPQEYADLTIVCEHNNADELQGIFREKGDQIAAVIFEPVVGNAGVLEPSAEFLAALQDARKAGALLIADEVMTGFRLSIGGACLRYGISADLICWGKIIGGGLPVGAYGGRSEVMDFVSPKGPVYQAGTLSGNPLAMAAGLATLSELETRPEIYAKLEDYGTCLAAGLRDAAAAAGVEIVVNQVGSMLTAFHTSGEIFDYPSAARSDAAAFGRWFQVMLKRGVYWAPSQFESIFVSAAHSEEDLQRTLQAAKEAYSAL